MTYKREEVLNIELAMNKHVKSTVGLLIPMTSRQLCIDRYPHVMLVEQHSKVKNGLKMHIV